MLIKSWLGESHPKDWLPPDERVRLRYYRQEGLRRWRFFGLAGSLPIILHLSLVLFLIGLGEFTRLLNPVVGWVTSGLMIAWFVVLISTSLSPVFFPQSPFRTPVILWCVCWVIKTFRALCVPPRMGMELPKFGLDDTGHKFPFNLEPRALAWAACYIPDRSVIDAIGRCLLNSRIGIVVEWIEETLKYRARQSRQAFPYRSIPTSDDLVYTAASTIFDALERAVGSTEDFADGLPADMKEAMVSILNVFAQTQVGYNLRLTKFLDRLFSMDKAVKRDLIRDVFVPMTCPIPTDTPWISDAART